MKSLKFSIYNSMWNEPGTVLLAFNPNAREAKAGRALSSRLACLQSKFQDNQNYGGGGRAGNVNNTDVRNKFSNSNATRINEKCYFLAISIKVN